MRQLVAVSHFETDAGPRSDVATKSLLIRNRELKFASAINDLVFKPTFFWSGVICDLSCSSTGAKKAPGSERVLGGLRTRATFPGAMFRAGNGSIRVHHPHEPICFPPGSSTSMCRCRSVICEVSKEETSFKPRKSNKLDPSIFVCKRADFFSTNDSGRWVFEAQHCDGGKIATTAPSGQLRFTNF